MRAPEGLDTVNTRSEAAEDPRGLLSPTEAGPEGRPCESVPCPDHATGAGHGVPSRVPADPRKAETEPKLSTARCGSSSRAHPPARLGGSVQPRARPSAPGVPAPARGRSAPPGSAQPQPAPRRPHLHVGVVAGGRPRGLRAAVLSRLRGQEQAVLALVAPRARPGRHPGRAARPGPERWARVHGGKPARRGSRSAPLRSRGGAWAAAGGAGRAPRRSPDRPGAQRCPGDEREAGVRAPGGPSSESGGAACRGRNHRLGGRSPGGPRREAAGLPGVSACRRGGGWQRSLRAWSRGDGAEVTMSTETRQPWAPAFLPRVLRHDPTFKGIRMTF